MTASEAVAKSRENTNSKPVAITMTEPERELLDELALNYGGRKGAVMAGLKSLNGLDRAEWPLILRTLADDIEKRSGKRGK